MREEDSSNISREFYEWARMNCESGKKRWMEEAGQWVKVEDAGIEVDVAEMHELEWWDYICENASDLAYSSLNIEKIDLQDAIRLAMLELDIEGEEPEDYQKVSIADLELILWKHPRVRVHYPPTKPNLTDEYGQHHPYFMDSTRNAREVIKREIRKVPQIEKRGKKRGSYYVYDSTKTMKTIPLLVSLLMRTQGDANFAELLSIEDSRHIEAIGGEQSLLEALWDNNETFYVTHDGIGDGNERPQLNPSIWSAADSYKRSYNLTLSEPASDLFEDLIVNMTALMKGGDGSDWWEAAFNQIPIPDQRLSKSLITEIALWNLYHSMHRMSGGDEGKNINERSSRDDLISKLVDDERFIAILDEIQKR
jgi:hypothetical protein